MQRSHSSCQTPSSRSHTKRVRIPPYNQKNHRKKQSRHTLVSNEFPAVVPAATQTQEAMIQATIVEGQSLVCVAERLSVGLQPLLDVFTSMFQSLHAVNHALPVKPSEDAAQQSRTGAKRKRKQTAATSAFFAESALVGPPSKQRNSDEIKVLPFSKADPISLIEVPSGLAFQLEQSHYGLIQERIRGNLFALVIQAILWNQTTGRTARPVLFQLLSTYPTPDALAVAPYSAINNMIQILGLGAVRTTRLLQLAAAWIAAPPAPERRYGRRNYPHLHPNKSVKNRELLAPFDEREGWEIAHLPGVGPYALDSYRIFYRDTLRGVDLNAPDVEPEWKRVVPLDKDLRPYLRWKWAQEGWDWDPKTGHKKKIV